jgi:hypothetical protein
LVGDKTLQPLYLQRDASNTLVLVAGLYACENLVDLGYPKPPYLAFAWDGKEWARIGVPDAFWGRAANLLVEPGPDTSGRLYPDDINRLNEYVFEYDATLVNIPVTPNCIGWANTENQGARDDQ